MPAMHEVSLGGRRAAEMRVICYWPRRIRAAGSRIG